LGVAAGYFGGRVDMVVTFLINVRLAMPLVLVALAVMADPQRIASGGDSGGHAGDGACDPAGGGAVVSRAWCPAAHAKLGRDGVRRQQHDAVRAVEGCHPGVVLFNLVLAINLMGDGLRNVTATENRS